MKIQCPCGAKYSFDITPEMASAPVQFICAACGLNSTPLVNQLIRQQFAPPPGAPAPATPPVATILSRPAAPAPPAPAQPVAVAAAAPMAPVPAPPPAVGSVASPPSQPAAPVPSLRVAVAAAPQAVPAAPAADAPQPCLKHMGQLATNRCVICRKPICPQCMALFGWVCSPLCKGKAEAQGIALPEYAGQKSVAERKQWRKVGRNAAIVAGVIALVLGVWTWYAWFGSVPKTTYSAKLPDVSTAGELKLGAQGQTILLHGGRLARHDPKAKREVWSVDLVDRTVFPAQAAAAAKEMAAARERARLDGADIDEFRMPSLTELAEQMEEMAEGAFSLHVAGDSVWVESDGKLTRHDWDTGKPGKEIDFETGFGGATREGNDLVQIDKDENGTKITRVDLASGEVKTESIARPKPPATASPTNTALAARGKPGPAQIGAANFSNVMARAGGRLAPGSKPLDPNAIARDVQNMPLPNRLALPATLAAAANQQRLMNELNDGMARILGGADGFSPDREQFRLIRSGNDYVQLGARLIETRTVSRKVLKDPPKKSVLDGGVNRANASAAINELLNDMQRELVGDSVEEEESRYQATVRRDGAPDWTGEVPGSPTLIPLQTVDVLLAGKSATVLDKKNKKLWEAKLTHSIVGGGGFDENEEHSPHGLGPCVERGDSLFLFDQGVLSCFDLATGNARWRMPSVGTAGLFFDDKGMLYVNTTTASPDSVKYSRQIDVTEKTRNLVLKLDPRTGKTLWVARNEGFVRYLSGKYIFTVQSDMGSDDEDTMGLGNIGVMMGARTKPHISIKRLKPSNGRVMWEHFEQRGPLDVQFNGNQIQILFKKELEVLRFLTL